MYLIGIILSFLIAKCALTRESFLIFFAQNERIHDIYWQSLLLLLTIFIPISIETFKFLTERFKKLGKSLYLYEVIKVERFYTLVPFFTFTFIFALQNNILANENILDLRILTFTHSLLLFLWMMMFWYVFGLLVASIRLLGDSGTEVYERIIKHLKNSDSQLSHEGIMENWKTIWKAFSLIRGEWHEPILSVFWWKINYYISSGKYSLANQLLADFSSDFLSISEQKDKFENVNWLNERRYWLWFHDKEFSDHKTNPYAIYVRFLEFYELVFIKKDLLADSNLEEVFGSGLDQLHRSLKQILESLANQELKNSNDGSYGLFKLIKEHVLKYTNDGNQEYLSNIPIYLPVFEHADNYSLQQDHGFPVEWRLSIKNIENLFGKNGDARMRLIWLNHFLNWSNRRISHEKKDFDKELDGSIEMLFPNMYNPWLALWLGFRNLSWSGNRIDSLCQWDRNFGFDSFIGESYWYDPSKSEEENEREMFAQNNALQIESKQNTARILLKLQAFGKIDDIRVLRMTLESLEGKYQGKRFAELNRIELLELFRFILEVG